MQLLDFYTTVPKTSKQILWKVVPGLVVATAIGMIANLSRIQLGFSSSPFLHPDFHSTLAAIGSDVPFGKVNLIGAGASFPAPLYQRWFVEYNKQNLNVIVNYQSIGSGAGIEQFTVGTIDFGASDRAMTDAEIARVKRGVVLLPMTAGMLTLTYNLPGVKRELKLPRRVYSDIFLGKIRRWNHPQITKANPGVSLPNLPITVLHRSDGGPTTNVFTTHLSAISPEWKSRVGAGVTVPWPVGVGNKGNEGIAAQILQTRGSIGYVEYAYAKNNNLRMAALENKAGRYVEPTIESGLRTLSTTLLPQNLRAFIADPQGTDSYPLTAYTWMMAYKNYDDPDKAEAIKAFLRWGLTEGQKYSRELGYVPLPQNVVTQVQRAVDTIRP
jgi:phosphate transport system substrate-binding protein